MWFEWDDDKAEANYAKHGIPFDLAVHVFDGHFRFEIEDDRYDYGEERVITPEPDRQLGLCGDLHPAT